MRKIINRRLFDTDTAELVCSICLASVDEFDLCAKLYKTKNGRFFLYGMGGNFTPFAGWKDHADIIEITPTQAYIYANGKCDIDDMLKYFEIEEA